jgi:hypothetical protein
MAFGSN